MRFSILVLLATTCIALRGEDWKPLFNGTDFTGWETYLSKPPATAQVPGMEKDAKGEYTQAIGINRDPFHAFSYVKMEGEPVLCISGDVPGGIASIASYSNFHLRLDYKWGQLRVGQKPTQLRNSGLLYHAHGQHGEGNGRWLPSHQFQVQPGFSGDYVAMGDGAELIHAQREGEKRFVYDASAPEVLFSNTAPDPARCGIASKAETAMDRWNTLDLYCVEDEVVHVVNGHVVLRAKSRVRLPDGTLKPLTAGRLELQAEGWEIFYRNVAIAPIAELPNDLK